MNLKIHIESIYIRYIYNEYYPCWVLISVVITEEQDQSVIVEMNLHGCLKTGQKISQQSRNSVSIL